MPLISPSMMIGAAVSVVVLAVWFLMQQRGVKAKQITALTFRKSGLLERVSADAKYGVAHLRDGGYMIRPTALLHERSGRPWATPKDSGHADQLRRRTELLMLREGDPAPLELTQPDYVGETVKTDQITAIENQSHRLASVQAVVDGDPGDRLAQHIGLAVLLAVIAAIGSWVAVFAVQMMNGAPV